MRLEQQIESMAEELGFKGRSPFSFRFPEITGTPTYNPDCVWFDGEPLEKDAIAIFEIDKDPSRKHRVGGAALANIVALKYARRLFYFAIAPSQRERVATTSIELLRTYLGDSWNLDSMVIASFDPQVIRGRIRNFLGR